jgi:lipoprotein-anchoring transpeptidase ErfK/SrfK
LKRGFFAANVLLGLAAAGVLGVAAQAASRPSVAPSQAAALQAGALFGGQEIRQTAIAPRIAIGSVRVGLLDQAAAAAAVRRDFARPLVLVVDGAVVRLHPARLATPYVAAAVGKAWNAAPGAHVDLVVSVHGGAVRAVVARLGKRFDHASVPAGLTLRAGVPVVSRDRDGHRLDRRAVVAAIVHALAANRRATLRFETKSLAPSVTRDDLLPVIVINRGLNRLTYVTRGSTRRFAVATGQSIYPTPAGEFHIVVMWKNPWWYPPTYDSWAKGLSPVPPGPSNPLGTRWMGLSAPGVGIHGTNNPASIGYSVSHGCIRMQVPDSEWLFDHVSVGTTVFIV